MRVVDLFCGAGGTSAGLAMVPGVVVAAAADACPRALATYRLNHPGHPAVQLDLSDHDKATEWLRSLGSLDGLVASPPCVSFSSSGRGTADCDLALQTVRLAVAVAGLRIVILENVVPFARSAMWRECRKVLQQHGFGAIALCKVRACDLGVPQLRRRVFMVCVRSQDTEAAEVLRRRAIALTQVYRPPPAVVYDSLPYLRGRTFFSPGCHRSPNVHPTDRPAPTLRTNCCQSSECSTMAPRPADAGPLAAAHVLSPAELAVLQGFPIGWRFAEPNVLSRCGMQIGNAVVPACMAWVFAQAMALATGEPPLPECSRTSLHQRRPTLPRRKRTRSTDEDMKYECKKKKTSA